MNQIFYVNNIRQARDLSELENLFSLVGDVESQRLELHPRSTRGAGFGIFVMATQQQAEDCIERFHGTQALGQTLSLTSHKPKCQGQVAKSGLSGTVR